MRWFAAILFIANVGLYLFYSTSVRERQLLQANPLPAVNEQSMLLHHELSNTQQVDCLYVGPMRTEQLQQEVIRRVEQIQLVYSRIDEQKKSFLYYEITVTNKEQQMKAGEILGRKQFGAVVARYFNQQQAEQDFSALIAQNIEAELAIARYPLNSDGAYWVEVRKPPQRFEQNQLFDYLKQNKINSARMRCEL